MSEPGLWFGWRTVLHATLSLCQHLCTTSLLAHRGYIVFDRYDCMECPWNQDVNRIPNPQSSRRPIHSRNFGERPPASVAKKALRADNIRSTYFAIRSNSRFTRAPGASRCRFVTSQVCGIIQSTKLAG